MSVLTLTPKTKTRTETSQEIVEQILRDALEMGLENVTLLGSSSDGSTYLSSSREYVPDVLWDLETAKMYVLTGPDE
jgi:hypothetical protein